MIIREVEFLLFLDSVSSVSVDTRHVNLEKFGSDRTPSYRCERESVL